MLNLLLTPQNKSVRILKIKLNKEGEESQLRHLNNLGFVVGAKISVVSGCNGNLIVKVKDSKIAIGEQIAKGIFVA